MEDKKIDGIRIVSYILAVLFIVSILAKFFIEEPVSEKAESDKLTQEVSPVSPDSQVKSK